MKNFIRAFALSLVVTGAFASTHIATSSSAKMTTTASNSAAPVAACPPNDPNACGM